MSCRTATLETTERMDGEGSSKKHSVLPTCHCLYPLWHSQACQSHTHLGPCLQSHLQAHSGVSTRHIQVSSSVWWWQPLESSDTLNAGWTVNSLRLCKQEGAGHPARPSTDSLTKEMCRSCSWIAPTVNMYILSSEVIHSHDQDVYGLLQRTFLYTRSCV